MKKIGTTVYMHRSYLGTKECMDILPKELHDHLLEQRLYDWTVLKYDTKTRKCSVIYCAYFETQREPIIYESHQLHEVIPSKWAIHKHRYYTTQHNRPIYHHKWMLVPKGYDRFDIEESKEWSKKWEKCIEKGDKKKIGYKKGWDEFLEKHKLLKVGV